MIAAVAPIERAGATARIKGAAIITDDGTPLDDPFGPYVTDARNLIRARQRMDYATADSIRRSITDRLKAEQGRIVAEMSILPSGAVRLLIL